MLPVIYEIGKARNVFLPIIPDTRKKSEKYTRVEGLLEPIHRAGLLIFNEAEHDDPDMKTLRTQFVNFSPKQKRIDGPDMIEGAVYILKKRADTEASQGIVHIKRKNSKKI